MKAVSTGIWRPLRWLLVLLCIGGGVFAAENNWLTSLRVGHMSLTNWLAQLTGDSTEEIVQVAEPLEAPKTSYETNTWVNTALFSAAATGWTLDPLKAASGSIFKTSSAPIAYAYSASLPAASFSSGFISYTADIFGPIPSAVTAATGTWISDGSGLWSNPANWSGGAIADGAGNTAHFDTLDITIDVTVTLDTSRTIGAVAIGDTNGTHHYTISPSGGSTLTFDNVGNDATLDQVAGSAGDTISVPIILNSDLIVTNASANVLTLSGGIAGSSSFQSVRFNGNITVSGNITNGGATQLATNVSGGTVIFSGTNSYKGGTNVSAGTLLVNGDNSAATGAVQVFGTGTLGGTGTIGGTVYTFDGTITGADATSVGTLTLKSNLLIDTQEGGGTYLANIMGTTSDLLAIMGTLRLGPASSLIVSGTLDGFTTYTIATFSNLVDDLEFGSVSGVPTNYDLVYHDMDIQLIPNAIPEPATWVGGALALGAIGFTQRKRLARRRPVLS